MDGIFYLVGPAVQMLWLCGIFQVLIHDPMKGPLQVQTELTQEYLHVCECVCVCVHTRIKV